MDSDSSRSVRGILNIAEIVTDKVRNKVTALEHGSSSVRNLNHVLNDNMRNRKTEIEKSVLY